MVFAAVASSSAPEGGSHAQAAAATCTGTLSAAHAGLKWIPQARSLLQAAVLSGDEATVRYMAEEYRARYPDSLRWQRHVGHGLWSPFPSAIQQRIAAALKSGMGGVAVQDGRREAHLDLRALRGRVGDAAYDIRCHLQNMIHPRDRLGDVAVTSDVHAVEDWDAAFVVGVNGALTAAAPDAAALALLSECRVVDPSLWKPGCKDEGRRALDVAEGDRRGFGSVLAQFVSEAFEGAPLLHDPLETTGTWSRRAPTARSPPIVLLCRGWGHR